MTSPKDLIYDSVWKQCMALKCGDRLSKDSAVLALEKYRKGLYKTPQKLIKETVENAKKIYKKSKDKMKI